MRTGKSCRPPARRVRLQPQGCAAAPAGLCGAGATSGGRAPRQRGFTYLLLLFALVIGGIGLAALGEQAQLRHQREREAEWQFRGEAIAAAIGSYIQASASRSLPSSVDDLLEDRRSGHTVRHLRQLYPDPLRAAGDTGPGWVWLAPGDAGCEQKPATLRAPGIRAVRSASDRPLLKRRGQAPQRACEIVFTPPPPVSMPSPSQT